MPHSPSGKTLVNGHYPYQAYKNKQEMSIKESGVKKTNTAAEEDDHNASDINDETNMRHRRCKISGDNRVSDTQDEKRET